MSRTEMKAASQHLDKHVTPSVHLPPSVSVSPTQTCSASPSEGLLSVATVERSQTIVICSGKETTPISHDSSLAPSDEAEQPNKTTETVLPGRETKSSTDENTVCYLQSIRTLLQNRTHFFFHIFYHLSLNQLMS